MQNKIFLSLNWSFYIDFFFEVNTILKSSSNLVLVGSIVESISCHTAIGEVPVGCNVSKLIVNESALNRCIIKN